MPPTSPAPSTCRRRAMPAPLRNPPPRPTAPLDEAFFRANIEPILQKKGSDGYACVNCHDTHTLFNATWSTVKNVIDRADPGEQPAAAQARRPPPNPKVSPAPPPRRTAAASAGPEDSPEYETILKWIQGRRNVETAFRHPSSHFAYNQR